MVLPPLQGNRLLLVALGFELFWALSLYAFPSQFSNATYNGIRPYLPYVSAAFLAGALALILLIRYRLPQTGRVVAAFVAAGPLLFMASYAISLSGWMSALNYGVMGMALLLLPWFRFFAPNHRPGLPVLYVYPLVLGLILLGVCLLVLLVPASLNTPASAWMRPYRYPMAIAGLLGAVALLLPQREPRSGLWRRLTAAVLPAFVGYGFLQTAAYTGVVWLIHATAILVLAQPVFTANRTFPLLTPDTELDPLDAGDRQVEFCTWLLVAVVVVLRPLERMPGYSGVPTILFVCLLSAFNLLRWALPTSLPRARQLFVHLVVLALATGLLLTGLSDGGALFAPVLILLPILAARSLGRTAATRVLAVGVGALLVGSLFAPGIFPLGEGLLAALIIATSALVAIHSVVQQRRQLKQVELISQVGSAIRQTLDLEPLLQTTVDELGRSLEASRCHVWLIDGDGVCTAAAEYAATGVPPVGVGHKVPISTMVLSEHGHGVVCAADIENDPRLAGEAETLKQFLRATGVRSLLAATIRLDGELIAAVTFHQCDRQRNWQREEADFLGAISGQVGLAIAHARTHAELVNSYQDLQAQGEELIAQQEELAAQNDELVAKSQALEETQSKLSGLIDNLAGMVYRYVWRGDWTIDFLAGTSVELTGYTVTEMHQTPFLGLTIAEDRSKVRSELDRAVAERRPYVFEYRIRTKEGRVRWLFTKGRPLFDDQGAPRALEGIVTDITDRKLAEEGLAQVSRENRLLLNSAGEGICGLDSRGRVTFVNPAALQMLGLQPADLLGQPMSVLLHPGVGHDWQVCPISQTMREGRPHFGQAVLRRKNDTPFHAEFVCTPKEERSEGAVVIFRDITERQAVERMKNEFISVVSHELRTPLTSIRGSLGLLSSGKLGSLPEKGHRMLQIATQNTDRLVRLINDILDIERIESGKVSMHKADCDAAQLVAHAVEVMQPVADKAGVTLDAQTATAKLWADSDRIIQTLTNLISNAIKFSEPGTVVKILAHAGEQQVRFSVHDQGRGIPAEKLEIIFERFQQVDASDSREKGGTGLGLAICRSIVHQHGGEIWAESVDGQGSMFSFTLPIRRDVAGLATAPAQGTEEIGARMLVVEDDGDLAQVLVATFQRIGIHVTHAATCADALAAIERHRPDVVLLDLVLPDGDGSAVAGALRGLERPGSLVVYTAKDLSQAERQALQVGDCTVFLTKGRTKPEELESRLSRLLERLAVPSSTEEVG